MTTVRWRHVRVPVLILLSLITFLFGQLGSALADDKRNDFGKKISGTYLAVQVNGAQILQIHNDGNLSFIFSEQFGSGALNDPFSNTLGSWRKTGKREITSKALDLTFESLTGTFVGVASATYVITFDKKFQNARVMCEGQIFPPGVDPFDPEAIPIPDSGFNCSDNEGLDFHRVLRYGETQKSNDD